MGGIQVRRKLPRCREVEHHSTRQRAATGRCLKLIPQLDRSKRVDSCLHQRGVGIDRTTSRAANQLKHSLKLHHSWLRRAAGHRDE
jgi:hypothetical protein